MNIQKRRRIEGKTDYKARLIMLKSGKPRVIIRKSNKTVTAQFIVSKEAQDSVEAGVNSEMLLKYGWPKDMAGSLKSIPAAYLTGLLLAKKVTDKKGEVSAILDTGMARNSPKSRIYAFLKGVIEGGIKISANEKIFPEEGRLLGKHMKKNLDVQKIKEKIKND